ncbi:hypothetical protein GCM10009090_15540 [[Pseudomonas] boreopolis]|uniref:Uncharacterized protein n=1 Tax=Xanthomonas boreopolis TaxID=86183 RepID=A0A919F7E6_9XANT|nr:hypothetical protein GCM10009090_15540 [[Pseudomonas] boreopolis]
MEAAAGASPLAARMTLDRVKVKTATAVQQNRRGPRYGQAHDSARVIPQGTEDMVGITGK